MESVENNKTDSDGQHSQLDPGYFQGYGTAANSNEELKESESVRLSSLVSPTNELSPNSCEECSKSSENQTLDTSLLERNLKEIIVRIKDTDRVARTSFDDLKHLITLATAQIGYIQKNFHQSRFDKNSNNEQVRKTEEGLKMLIDLFKKATGKLKASAKVWREECDRFSFGTEKTLNILLKCKKMEK
jgi:hypothetical protein